MIIVVISVIVVIIVLLCILYVLFYLIFKHHDIYKDYLNCKTSILYIPSFENPPDMNWNVYIPKPLDKHKEKYILKCVEKVIKKYKTDWEISVNREQPNIEHILTKFTDYNPKAKPINVEGLNEHEKYNVIVEFLIDTYETINFIKNENEFIETIKYNLRCINENEFDKIKAINYENEFNNCVESRNYEEYKKMCIWYLNLYKYYYVINKYIMYNEFIKIYPLNDEQYVNIIDELHKYFKNIEFVNLYSKIKVYDGIYTNFDNEYEDNIKYKYLPRIENINKYMSKSLNVYLKPVFDKYKL